MAKVEINYDRISVSDISCKWVVVSVPALVKFSLSEKLNKLLDIIIVTYAAVHTYSTQSVIQQ